MRSAFFIHIAAISLIFQGGCAIGPGKERMEAAKQSEATGNPRPYQPSNEVEKIEVPETTVIASQAVGDASKDALAHYGFKPATAKERLEGSTIILLLSNRDMGRHDNC